MLVLFSFSAKLNAQSLAQTEEVKAAIDSLGKQHDIISINNLLNRNTFLPPDYTLEVILSNLRKAESSNDKEALADTYLTLGNFWYIQGDFAKAYENYTHSEAICIQNSFLRFEGISKLNKSNLEENLTSKIEMLKETVAIFEKTNDTLNLAKSHLNLASSYEKFVFDSTSAILRTEKISFYKDLAFTHFSFVKKLNVYAKNPEIDASLFTHFGDWFLYEKNFSEARTSFETAEKYFASAGRTKGIAYCKMRVAQSFIEEKKFNKVLDYLKQAGDIALEYDYKDYLATIYKKTAEIYEASSNFAEAYHYQELYVAQSIELAELNSKDKIHIINLQHDLSEKQYAAEKYEQQKKLNLILIFVGIFIILSVAGISYLIIQNKKRKADSAEKREQIAALENEAISIKLKNQILQDELLKEKVQFGQNHLVTFANQVNKIDEFLGQLKAEIKKIQKDNDNPESINSLRLSFSEILAEQNKLAQINSFSSKLNQEFFFYLQKNYPEISNEDEILLAHIILDKSAKEISRILNISGDSIYKKRYRLRKKLKLQTEETFQGFYNQITAKIHEGETAPSYSHQKESEK